MSKKVCLKVICLLTLTILFSSHCFAFEINIIVSPKVLNINSQGEVVTVHTDINYSTVAGSSVSLNGVEIKSWKADDRGFFVAKFLMEEIKDLPLKIDDYNTLKLEGYTVDDEYFWGQTEIKVVDKKPKN
ncbi:hypothetical protein KKB18_02125 [bacterium]|nr:hypothetical protein [bacterium]